MGGKGSGGYRKNALPRDKNPAVLASDPKYIDPDLNSRVINFMKACMKIEEPDFADENSVEEHFYEYLRVCEECNMRPMIGNYAASMGMNHHEFLGVIQHDPRFNYVVKKKGLTPRSVAVLQKSYDFLKISWEASLMDDKGNPVKWIFLGKNYFGMKDQSEKVQYNVEIPKELPNPEDVKDKYAAMVGRQPKAVLENVEDVPKDEE